MGNKDAAKTNYGKLFRALGDEHRLHILRLLAECEMNAQELLVSCDIVQSTLSHHMKTLQEGSLVRVRRDGKWTYYTLNTDALEMAKQYLDELRVDAASAQKKAEERQGDQPAAAVAGENAEPSASTKAEKAAEKRRRKQKRARNLIKSRRKLNPETAKRIKLYCIRVLRTIRKSRREKLPEKGMGGKRIQRKRTRTKP